MTALRGNPNAMLLCCTYFSPSKMKAPNLTHSDTSYIKCPLGSPSTAHSSALNIPSTDSFVQYVSLGVLRGLPLHPPSSHGLQAKCCLLMLTSVLSANMAGCMDRRWIFFYRLSACVMRLVLIRLTTTAWLVPLFDIFFSDEYLLDVIC